MTVKFTTRSTSLAAFTLRASTTTTCLHNTLDIWATGWSRLAFQTRSREKGNGPDCINKHFWIPSPLFPLFLSFVEFLSWKCWNACNELIITTIGLGGTLVIRLGLFNLLLFFGSSNGFWANVTTLAKDSEKVLRVGGHYIKKCDGWPSKSSKWMDGFCLLFKL